MRPPNSIAEQIRSGMGVVQIGGKLYKPEDISNHTPTPKLKEEVKTPAPKTTAEKQIDLAQQQLDTQKQLVEEIRKALKENRVEMKNQIELIINQEDGDLGSQLESALLKSLDNVANKIDEKL